MVCSVMQGVLMPLYINECKPRKMLKHVMEILEND